MAFTEKRLSGPTTPAGGATLYTCPTAQQTTTLIKQIVVSAGASGGSYTVNLVPYGNSTSSANRILAGNLNVNETIIIDLSQVLTSGDYLYGTSSADVRITISGIENAGGMVTSGLADNAVTTAKIADSNVTAAKLGPDAFIANNQAGAIVLMEMM